MCESRGRAPLADATVHPNVFHNLLEHLPIAGWQVIDEGGHLRVLLAGAGLGIDPNEVDDAVRAANKGAGRPSIA